VGVCSTMPFVFVRGFPFGSCRPAVCFSVRAMVSWITVPGAPRPDPQVGDWLRAGRIRLRFWEFAPSDDIPIVARWRECNFEFMGPVHASEETERFTSVRIPNPAFPDEELVWLNIWCYENAARQRRGVNFATIVPVDMVLSWQQRGWQNRFLDHGVEPPMGRPIGERSTGDERPSGG
jgi:hypothetical protein